MSEVIICPLCGFSFRSSYSKTEKDKIKCPMCGFEFGKPQISPYTQKKFNKKF